MNERQRPKPRRPASGGSERSRVTFTEQELRVLQLLARGDTYQSVARNLFVSPATVAYHASRMQRQLGVSNNAALVAAAVVTGLLAARGWPLELTGVTDIDVSTLPQSGSGQDGYTSD